jgi:hypothetical protein
LDLGHKDAPVLATIHILPRSRVAVAWIGKDPLGRRGNLDMPQTRLGGLEKAELLIGQWKTLMV